MAVRVPDNNDYSLVSVRDAVKDHAASVQDNLDSCFAFAISSYFDSNYNNNTYAGETTGRSLKRFRNYGPPLVSPEPGVFNIANPYHPTKYNGRSIFVSKNGLNMYIHLDVSSDSPGVSRIFRYTMSSPHALSTATFHSEMVLNASLPGSMTRGEIYFNDAGSVLLVGVKTSASTLAGVAVESYVLSANWSINSGHTRYYTDINFSGPGVYAYHRAITFTDTYGVLATTETIGGGDYTYPWNMPLDSIKNYSSVDIASYYSNFPFGVVIRSTRVEPIDGKYWFSRTYSGGDYELFTIPLTAAGAPQTAVTPTSVLQRNTSYFVYHVDFHLIYENLGYSAGYVYVLEDNRYSSELLFPRVALYF